MRRSMQLVSMGELTATARRHGNINDKINSIIESKQADGDTLLLFKEIKMELTRLEYKLNETVKQRDKMGENLDKLEEVSACHVCYEDYANEQAGI